MKQVAFSQYEGSKAYITEGDYSAQSIYRIDKKTLDIKVKIWLLLTDRLLIPRAGMLNSRITYHWIMDNAELISALNRDGVIVCGTWGPSNPFSEYLEDKYSRGIIEEEHSATLKERARRLSEVFQTFVYYEPQVESEWFRDSLVDGLLDPDSPLRIRMGRTNTKAIEKLAARIENEEFLRRRTLWELIDEYCPKESRLIKEYGNIFYYLSGSRYHGNSLPILDPHAAILCNEESVYEAGHVYETKEQNGKTIIDLWDIKKEQLGRIPLADVVALRESGIGQRIREYWNEIIESGVPEVLVETGTALSLAEERDKALQELFSERMRRERKALKQYWVADVLATLLVIAAGIGTARINPPVSAIGSSALSFALYRGMKLTKKYEPGITFTVAADRVNQLAKRLHD